MLRSGGASLLSHDDLEVAEILLSLPRLIYSNVRWTSKKKRSVIRSHQSVSSKGNPTSPSSPFNFPADCDGKFLKRKRCEELREDIERLQKRPKLYSEDVDHLLIAKKVAIVKLVFDVDLTELGMPEEISQKTKLNSHEEEPITLLGSSTPLLSPCPLRQVGPTSSSAVGSHLPNNVGPVEIPDLNLPAADGDDCLQQLDPSLGSCFTGLSMVH